jgi:hypothetical protein
MKLNILKKITLLEFSTETLLFIAESLGRAHDILCFAQVTKRTYGLLLSTLHIENAVHVESTPKIGHI